MEQSDKLIFLLEKFFHKTASVEELGELALLLAHKGAEEDIFEKLDADFQLSEDHLMDLNTVRAQEIFEHIVAQPQPQEKRRLRFARMAIAASIIGVLFSLTLYILIFHGTEKSNTATIISADRDIPPGKQGATLILANGSKISLSDHPNGEIADESGVRILKSGSGDLIYDLSDQTNADGIGKNTLSTSNGQTFRVKLPDGSMIWLNSASKITYPSSYASQKLRTVELEGEAYFEVARDEKHPFIVKSATQMVQVLGTHFNVKAYPGDSRTLTTLSEGSVKVLYKALTANERSNVSYQDEIVLNPGEQSMLFGSHMHIGKVELEIPLSWKEGNFIFNNNSIEEIMKDVSRWYNVEVIYGSTIPKGSFSGNVSRSKNISQILKALETTKLVHFKIEGRRVYVTE